MVAAKRSAVLRYGVAVAALVGTVCGGSLLGPEAGPVLFFAVVVSAWFGGLGPGLFSVGVLVGLIAVDAITSGEPVRPGRFLGIAAFGLLGVGITLLLEALHSVRRRAERNAEALREADRRKDEFLAMLGHELRNPLAAIACAVEVLRQSDDAEDREWSDDVIARQSRHLARLIDDLLDVSRITRGKIPMRTEAVEINALVRETVSSACPLIAERRHRVDVGASAGPVYVQADPVRLQQVFVNLLNNAAKYTEAGGRIDVHVHGEKDKVSVTVRDNGVGIPPDQLPRMFNLFEQSDRSLARSEGGLGIGLTLVRLLVELHGGTVTAFSEGQGKGSAFTVTLPTLRHEAASALAPESDTGTVRVDRPALRILVVDDNVDAARGLTKLLRMSGHHVETRYDGPSALEAASNVHPQVVLLDVGLPGMNGFEVAERLRESTDGDNVTIIAISGYANEQRGNLAAPDTSPFDFHFVKPVAYDELITLISELGQTPRDESRTLHELG